MNDAALHQDAATPRQRNRLPVGTLEKALRLLHLLQEIAGDPALYERLALKGGTALNLFHLDLDRLSVDINLNYVGALDRAAMESERATVDTAIGRLLASHGYGVRRSAQRACWR